MTNMYILEVSIPFINKYQSNLGANTLLGMGHVSQFPQTLNKESKGSSLRGNPRKPSRRVGNA